MTFRLLSRTVRPAFELIVLHLRAAGDKNVEILVPCHQLAVTAPPGRPAPLRCRPGPAGRLAQLLPSRRWHTFLVRPDALLRWHRQLIARRWTYLRRSRGRGPTFRLRKDGTTSLRSAQAPAKMPIRKDRLLSFRIA